MMLPKGDFVPYLEYQQASVVGKWVLFHLRCRVNSEGSVNDLGSLPLQWKTVEKIKHLHLMNDCFSVQPCENSHKKNNHIYVHSETLGLIY